jgi:hypothetical protein
MPKYGSVSSAFDVWSADGSYGAKIEKVTVEELCQ